MAPPGVAVFAALMGLTLRRGATDPVCGLRIDRARALRADHAGRAFFFCSDRCRKEFEEDPDRYASHAHAPREARVATRAHSSRR
jgi:YHS domain-containing protein